MILGLLLLFGLVGTGVGVSMIGTASASTRRTWSDRTAAFLAFGALGWTILVGAVLLVAPTYSTTSSVSTPTGEVTTTSNESLIEHEGTGVVLILLVPVVIAFVGALGRGRSARARRIGAGALLAVCCLLGAASIGIFYAPAPVLLITAGVRKDPAGQPRASIPAPVR